MKTARVLPALLLALLGGPLAAQSTFAGLNLRNLGPAVAGGRVTAVVGIPGNPRVYYVGTAGGGAFKSSDGGLSWQAIFSHGSTASIGAVALAPSDPDTVWLGTGEANPRNDVITGAGVFLSRDGGHHWRPAGLRQAGQISSILVNPQNPGTVLVGVTGNVWGPSTERGVFRTTDFGKSWHRVLYVNDTTGVSDLAMDPVDPDVIYAAMWRIRRYPWKMVSGGPGGGIYKSTDGGRNWQRLSSSGLPSPPLGRIGLAISLSRPQHVYALIGSKQGILWDSPDAGAHWRLVSRNWLLNARPWYFGRLAVSPRDDNTVYFLSFHLLKSLDGGRSVGDISRGMHADNHAIWIDPRDPDRIIEGNDGGVYISQNGGQTWRFADGLPIEQAYSVAVDNRTPFTICAGLQDNSSWCGPARVLAPGRIPNQEWWTPAGGDGQYAVPAPGSDLVFADSQNGVISARNRETGAGGEIRPYLMTIEEELESKLRYRFGWTAPIAVNPGNGNQVYLGGNVLFRSDDAGAHWKPISPDLTRDDKAKQGRSGGPVENDLSGAETYDTILSIAVAPLDPSVIWVGTDDGLVQLTTDGGRSWRNVTPGAAPAWGRIEQIAVSPFDASEAYAAVDEHENDDDHAFVFRTRDFGANWQSIAAGLPADTPVHVVREDPDCRGLLVAGTDTGLFYSRDDGGSWAALVGNFPTASVTDLKFQPRTHDLVVATHGRGLFVLDDISPLEQWRPAMAEAPLTLFPPLPAMRAVEFKRYSSDSYDGAAWSAENRHPGAMIQYTLLQPVARGVSLTITDAEGAVVRHLSGPGRAGLNRAIWDLRYDPAPLPPALRHSVPSAVPAVAAGPPVAPGSYRVRVQVGGAHQTVNLTVIPDSRFPANLEALREQTTLGLQVRALIEELVHALDNSEQIAAPPGSSLAARLGAWRAPLFNPAMQSDSKYYLHSIGTLDDRLQRLATTVNAGYNTPPSDAERAALARLQAAVSSAVSSLNHLLAAATPSPSSE